MVHQKYSILKADQKHEAKLKIKMIEQLKEFKKKQQGLLG